MLYYITQHNIMLYYITFHYLVDNFSNPCMYPRHTSLTIKDKLQYRCFSKRKLLIAASKLLNRGIQITESRHPNYWIAASKLLKTATSFWPPGKPRQGGRTATGQRRPLLQVEMGRSMLPDRRQKRKLNATSCSRKTKLGILHTEKMPACTSYLCSWHKGR